MLGGILVPDSGRVRIAGRVGHVHQHFALPPGLTSAECLALEEPGLRLATPARLGDRFREIEARVGLDLGRPDAEAARLAVGARQRLEFARARASNPDLLILDEPTAVLAPPEVDRFMVSVRETAANGAAVVFITHKLAEIFGFCDRVSVLRRGRLVSSRLASEATPASLAAEFLEGDAPPAPRRGLRAPTCSGSTASEASVRIRRFRSSFARVRSSRWPAWTATGKKKRPARSPAARARLRFPRPSSGGRSPAREFRRQKTSVIPGDRRREGLILDFTVEENLRLAEPIPVREPARSRSLIERFGIDPPAPGAPARSLSGGNQQKVVLARELSREPRFLLAVSPTRGLDLASTRMTRGAIRDAAGSGAAVLLVTSDLDEARELADTMFVLYRGRLAGPFRPDEPSAAVGRAMAGLRRAEAASAAQAGLP